MTPFKDLAIGQTHFFGDGCKETHGQLSADPASIEEHQNISDREELLCEHLKKLDDWVESLRAILDK